jgi:hypothetical protein
MTSDDLVDFKNDWDGECEALLAQQLVEPKSGCCGSSTNKSMPVRHLRSFMEGLSPESVVGEARRIGNQVVWWNRLLYELSIQPQCSLYGLEPASIHEAEQGQADSHLLNRLIDFSEVVKACNLMRTSAIAAESDADPLTMLTYGDRVELQEKLDKAREECAYELLRASVNAWRMLRYPPPEVAEKIAADPNHEKVWNMQVRFCETPQIAPIDAAGCRKPVTTCPVCAAQVVMARTLMITTVIQRTKIG